MLARGACAASGAPVPRSGPWSPRPRGTSLPGQVSPLPPLCAEWFATSTDSYILRDLDDTSVVEDGRKKLNTLAHYKVILAGCGKALLPRSLPGPRGELRFPSKNRIIRNRQGGCHSSARASGE